ncbi:MAG: GNAT family N-acetyltransferase [Sulfitobacter sp.]
MFDHAPVQNDHALMQDPAFARALRLCGQSPLHLSGGLMVLRRHFAGVPVAMIPRASPPPDLRTQLRAAGLHRTPLILSPDQPADLPFALRLRKPRQIAMLDLHPSPEALRAGLHAKWRNQLRQAEGTRLKVRCTHLPPDPDTPVLRAEALQSGRRNYANWPAPLTAAFASVAPNQTHMFCALDQGQTVATMLFLTHGSTATYHIGHITPAGKAHCAHNLLMWEAMQRLRRHGISQLDLGQLNPNTETIDRFKLRAGAQARATGGTHLYWRPLARG